MCWGVLGIGVEYTSVTSVLCFGLELKTSHDYFHKAKIKTTESNDVYSCYQCLSCKQGLHAKMKYFYCELCI